MRRPPATDDRGSAVLEFVIVAVLLLVPLAYGVMSVMRVQAASLASTQAAREAGRAFVTADSVAEGHARARTAAGLAFADQGFALPADALRVTCASQRCLEPGGSVVVELDWAVDLPWVPTGLVSSAVLPIHAVHDVPVDVYRLTS